jgi:beta-lactamase regulating signal transducer with metallopeptidase domain
MTADLLLSILVRGAALLALVGVGAFALRRASAAHRHLAWTLGAAALLVLPAVTLTAPAIPWAVLPATTAPTPSVAASSRAPTATQPEHAVAPLSTTTASVDRAPDAAPEFAPAESAGPRAVVDSPPTRMPSPVVLVWLAGAIVVTLRLVVGARGVRRLVARSTSVADERVRAIADEAASRLGATRTPSVLTSDDVDSPITVGALRPQVLLPTAALSWPAERLRLALLHEFAHVRRRDLLAELAARVAVVVHWPNPLAWIAVSRLRIERERACDDLVLADGGAADEYADFLVSLARALRPTPSVVAATMAGGPQFERRVEAILDARHDRLAPSAKAAVVFVALASVALSFAACVQPTPATNDETPRNAAQPTQDAPKPFVSPPEQRIFHYLSHKPGTAVYDVALGSNVEYPSISAALAAAPAGSIVRVGPGVFDERLVVTKAVTIEGDGADKTTIVADVDATNPTLSVRGVRDVVVRGVTLTGRGKHMDGTLQAGGIVDVVDARARLENVAVVGGPASGVVIGPGADVELVGCLVAGVWNNGIAVAPAGAAPPKVRIADCDVRNCWSRGVSIGAGDRDVLIERCRISGASWHGIRYDDAAPTLKENVIFENVRSGIYASGETEGRIEGNFFFENGMSDVSCWYDAKDVVEQNWFVNSKREAVAILGASAPVIRKNVFWGCKTALMAGGVSGREGTTKYAGGGTIEDNAMCNVGTKFQKPAPDGKGVVDTPLPEGNKAIDIRMDGEVRPLTRAAFARSAEKGVGWPVSFDSPWPARPEETATAPKPEPQAKDPRAVDVLKQAEWLTASQKARAEMEPVKSDVLQISDAARRERGLDELAAALKSDNPHRVRAALNVIAGVSDVKYDKSRFRPDVLRHLESTDAVMRRVAGYALLSIDRDPGDLDRVLAIVETSPDASDNLRYVALVLAGNRAEGRLAKVFIKAVSVDDGQAAMDAANDLRRMSVALAPELEDAVVAAWRRHPTGRNGSGMWPYIFGQITSPAREARVRAVFELMASGDDVMRQLAGPAITKPVDESARAVAAQLAADGLATAPTAALRRTYLDVLQANGGRGQVATLRALADNAMVGDDLRAQAAKVADALERR